MINFFKKVWQSSNKKILFLLVALVSFIIADGLMTQFLVPSGKAKEANPFIEPLVGHSSFLILKIVGGVLCAVLLWDIHRRFPKVGLIATWIAVIGYGAIVLWNTSLVLQA
ncbi:MAG: DUF5658 family protein [Dehalococcoidales bacterium]